MTTTYIFFQRASEERTVVLRDAVAAISDLVDFSFRCLEKGKEGGERGDGERGLT